MLFTGKHTGIKTEDVGIERFCDGTDLLEKCDPITNKTGCCPHITRMATRRHSILKI
jgi:hypothetical protein